MRIQWKARRRRLGQPAARLAGNRRMIQITPQMRILVAVESIDGRKGIDCARRLCREKLEADPFSGYCLFSAAAAWHGHPI